MQIVRVETLCAGKFLNGFFVTVYYVSAIKMINETVPVYLLGVYGPICQTCAAIGFMLCFGLGMLLPQSDYDPEHPQL
jgi:hypothetical protein